MVLQFYFDFLGFFEIFSDLFAKILFLEYSNLGDPESALGKKWNGLGKEWKIPWRMNEMGLGKQWKMPWEKNEMGLDKQWKNPLEQEWNRPR